MNNSLSKRKIAIFTDAHALLEPTLAVLNDIQKRGITEIYSLGDNIGGGPNPSEVLHLLEENHVISLAGNSEEYITLGIEPFRVYFDEVKTKSQLWTLSQLNEREQEILSLYPHSIELFVGGKRIALCHFANDVRFDYFEHNSFLYQDNFHANNEAYKQFLYTNSQDQLELMQRMLETYGVNSPMMKGYLSAIKDPLFAGKRVDNFDAVIQGHVHWKLYEQGETTDFYSIRAVGMGYHNDPIDTASYVILNETEEGFELEEILVTFDREKLEYRILNSDSPDQTIKKFVKCGKYE